MYSGFTNALCILNYLYQREKAILDFLLSIYCFLFEVSNISFKCRVQNVQFC